MDKKTPQTRAYRIMHEKKTQIINMWNEGATRTHIIRMFRVSDRSVEKYLRIWQTEEPELFDRFLAPN